MLAPQLKDIVLEQGAVLQEQGERIDQVYFPHDGIVSLLAVMRQGDAIETSVMKGRWARLPDSGRAGRTRVPSFR